RSRYSVMRMRRSVAIGSPDKFSIVCASAAHFRIGLFGAANLRAQSTCCSAIAALHSRSVCCPALKTPICTAPLRQSHCHTPPCASRLTRRKDLPRPSPSGSGQVWRSLSSPAGAPIPRSLPLEDRIPLSFASPPHCRNAFADIAPADWVHQVEKTPVPPSILRCPAECLRREDRGWR